MFHHFALLFLFSFVFTFLILLYLSLLFFLSNRDRDTDNADSELTTIEMVLMTDGRLECHCLAERQHNRVLGTVLVSAVGVSGNC